MTDKINKKVIDIFAKNKKNSHACHDEKINRCEDGYFYVCMKSDLNGKHFVEENLIKNANNCYYIVKVMVKQGLHPFIYNYKIPGEKIFEFIELYTKGEKEGRIIEIDKFYPEDWA
jgi:hypothetical protein